VSPTRLSSLLARWQQEHERGRDLPVSELCRDCPELAADLEPCIALLRQIKPALPSSVADTLSAGPLPPRPDGVPALDVEAPPPDVPGYEILGELGRGGMGVVYKARQVELDRVVALKVVLAGAHAAPEQRARFLAEAKAVAALSHPGIVQVHDCGTHQGLPFFALEYCPGGNLAARLQTARPSPREAAALVERLARAVQCAHEAGIIHRDLKPANVLLDAGGAPKIADFGLAKRADAAGLTRTGALLGTPCYMAPEQAAGRAAEVGNAADVYALGAILYECLTGRPPFLAATVMDTLRQVTDDDPVPPRGLRAEVPPDLETVCLKCLHKEPAKRYSSAAALADDLNRFLAGAPVRARPAGALERAWRWCRRNPAVAGLLAACAVALLASGAGGVALAYSGRLAEARDRAEKARRRAEAQREEAEHQREEAEHQRQLARRYLYAARMNLAQQAWDDAQLPTLGALLAGLDAETGFEELRGFEWDYLTGLLGRPGEVSAVLPVSEPLGRLTGVAFTPDGRTVVTANCLGTVRLRDANTWSVQATLYEEKRFREAVRTESGAVAVRGPHLVSVTVRRDEHWLRAWDLRSRALVRSQLLGPLAPKAKGRPVASVALSADGKCLAWAANEGRVALADAAAWLARGAPRRGREFPAHAGGVTGVAFSPSAALLASAGSDGVVRLWACPAGEDVPSRPERELKGHSGPVWGVAFSPDGQSLASAGEDGTVRLWEAGRGREAHRLTGHTGPVLSVAFSTDGRRLAGAGDDRTVRVWDVASRKVTTLLRGHASRVNAVAFSPDGRRVASCGDDRHGKVWDLRAAYGPLRLGGGPAVAALAFAPGGRALAAAGPQRKLELWDLGKRARALQLPGLAHGARGLAFSPDGRLLAAAAADNRVKVWAVRAGREAHSFGGHRGLVRAVAFSPDATLLASAGDDGAIKLWERATGREGARLPGHGATKVYSLAFSPGGEHLVSTGQDRTVRVWQVREGREVHRLEGGHSDGVLAAAFRAGGTLATASQDQTVRLWDVKTGAKGPPWPGHTGWVLDVAFSPEGRRLASASDDGHVKLWDVETGQVVFNLRGGGGALRAVAFRDDGTALAAAGDAGALNLWVVAGGR
jgi:WD40 repeat protein